MAEVRSVLQILRDQKIIGQSSLSAVYRFMAKWQVSEFDAVLETNLASASELADVLASTLGLTRVHNAQTAPVNLSALKCLDFAKARSAYWLPVRTAERDGLPALEMIVADPTDHLALNAFAEQAGRELEIAVGEKCDILRAVEKFYPLDCQIPSIQKLMPRL